MVGKLVRQPGTRRFVALALCSWAIAAWSQAPTTPPAGIYTCIDDKGRRVTADRPIPECAQREQQVLNSDGSVRMVVPPTPTAEERAAREARERAAAEARAGLSHEFAHHSDSVAFAIGQHRPREGGQRPVAGEIQILQQVV